MALMVSMKEVWILVKVKGMMRQMQLPSKVIFVHAGISRTAIISYLSFMQRNDSEIRHQQYHNSIACRHLSLCKLITSFILCLYGYFMFATLLDIVKIKILLPNISSKMHCL